MIKWLAEAAEVEVISKVFYLQWIINHSMKYLIHLSKSNLLKLGI